MAKKRGRKTESTVNGYFRGVFNERPDWLQQKSNDEVLARYRADHHLSANAEVEPNIKNAAVQLEKHDAAGSSVLLGAGPLLSCALPTPLGGAAQPHGTARRTN